MAGVGNFVLGNLPNLIRQQRDDGDSAACQRHEFHRAALAAFVNKHDRADVVLAKPCSGKSVVKTTLSSSLIIIKYPMDTLWLM
jgi:hypothetical protein